MDIKEDMAKDSKSQKPKWDGKSRVSNDTYRKRWNEIFGENKTDDDEKPKTDTDASD